MTLTDEARAHLDRYLEEMRASLDRSDSEEIEQDIRDHIEAELGDRPSPVSAEDLDAVLGRLGSPRQWAADTGASPSLPVPDRHAAEDWLAYAGIALLLLGFLLPVLLPVSWVVARWALARLEQRGEQPGARRWLLYPPLAIVSFAIALLALCWPLGAFAEIGMTVARNHGAVGSDRFPPPLALAVAAGCLGGYWIILGAVAALGQRAVRFLFHPFARGFRARHGWWLSAAGAVLAVCATAVFIGSR
jgi:hypothetical protein